MNRRIYFLLLVVLLFPLVTSSDCHAARSWSSASYVPININSGNPAFPYPQFLEYKVGKTLAKYNAEGVTHADMEKTGREAYEIMSHRCRYDGGTHCGVPYITFNNFRKFGDNEMPQGGAEFCTEGDGYMMLAAAIFADQATFNGLWMWIHDNRIPHRVRYQDGQIRLPNYEFGGGLPICYAMEGSTSENHGSATDGDDDIAMALLIAYKQWGEFMMQDGKQVLDYSGKPISYKEAAEDFLKAFVDTFSYTSVNGDGTLYNGGHMSGNIGVDGYVKGGNKGKEVSSWRNTQTTYPDISQFSNISGGGGDGNTHTDYCAPAYYNEFAKWFESDDVDANEWQIGQYKRAEASSDWLCGQAYRQGLVSSIGTTNMATDGQPTFTNFSEGEDFRTMWRMAQNYLWHGAPEYSWNPKTHQIESGSNTYEYDMALRAAGIMKEPPAMDGSGMWCGKLGASPDPGQPSFYGPSQIKMCYNINGGVMSHYGANYALGCAAPAVVINEDLDLIADLYRQSELMWDDASGESSTLTDDQRYIESMPKYFHGWFRCLPLLTYTGNWHAPSDMVSAANMKVYMSVDKTYAYVDDPIDYTVQYRNYGSADAAGVKIETEIDPNYEVVSISNGGQLVGNKIVWNIGSVPGFKSGHLKETIDSVSFRVIARDTLNPRICLTSKISGSNFEDWVSNEYPNHATYTMERNCVDILANRTLMIKKSANRTKLNPNDAVTFTVEFSNSSEGGEASWLNGGRDHVNLSYGNTIMESYGFRQFYRFWNDAHEAYIDLGNYRMSYFMNDGAAIGLYDAVDNPTGWTFQLDNGNDMAKYGWMPNGATTKFTYQKLPIGSDEYGKWNQRIMIQFPKTLMATTTHVYDKLDSKYLLHKGGWGPCFFRTVLKTNPAQEVPNRVADDWSYDSKLDIKNLDGQAQIYTLVSPNFADYNNLGYEVRTHSRYACDPLNNPNFDRVLVEEFDGYTWRRIIGRGPLPGREAYDVTVVDTIPYELEWVCWKDSTALKDDNGDKIKAKYIPAANPKSDGYSGIVKWTIPVMLVGEEDKLVYMCKARDLGCPDVDDTYYMNVAWISSKTDSPDSSRVELMTTCAQLPPQIEPQDALFKSASKKKVEIGDEVTYEIKFKNTLGTSVDVNCKSTNDIIKLGNGTLPEIGSNGFKLQTKGDNVPYFFAHDHCYGKDGEVYFTIKDGSNNQETFIVFRYESGTPGSSNFKGIAMKIMVNKDGNQNFGYYLYNNGKLIESQGTSWQDSPIQFPGDNKNVKFKFVLDGEKLYMYINDEEDEWSNVLKDWSGMTASGPGYFGAYVNSNGNADCQLTQFETNLDYAFDITIGDDLPAELSNITNISDNGTYNSSKHSITWPTFATKAEQAMAPGDSVVYTFDATVSSCDKFVNNYGWATVYGLDSLKVLNTIECGTEEECKLFLATLVASKTSACEGDSILLKASYDDGMDGSRYLCEFFKDGVSLGTASYKTTFYAKESGLYHAVVKSSVDPTCYLETDKIPVVIYDRPKGDDFDLGTLCVGTLLDNNTKYTDMMSTISDAVSTGLMYRWLDDNGGVPAVYPQVDMTTSGDFDKGFYIYSEEGCSSDTFHLTYTVADTAEVKLSNVTICAGQSATLEVTSDASYTYKWSDGSTGNQLVTDQAGTYSVEVTTSKGCVSRGSATVTVADKLEVDLGKDTTLCEANLPYILDATSNYNSFLWSDGSTSQTFSVMASGEYEVQVTQGACSGSGSVKVTVSTVEDPTGTFEVGYRVSDTTSTGVFDKTLVEQNPSVVDMLPNMTYTWYDKDKNKINGGAPIPQVPAGGGNATYTYYVSATNADGCESGLKEVTVTVSGAPTPDVSDVELCLGEDATTPLSATATPSSDASETWTLQWYDASGSKIAAPTPSTGSVGETTYYVTQISDLTGAESGKVSVKVMVYGTAEPSVANNKTSYCSGDTYEPLQVTSNANASQYLMPGKMVWTMDGTEVTGTPTIPQSESVTFTVREDYEIAANHVCKGTPVELVITTTTIEKPTGDMTVNYLKKEGEGGMFPSLTDKNANVAKASTGNKLVWYDANKNELGSTAPSPAYDNTWAAGTDQTLTYYVAQTDGTCTSELVEVTVNISDSPMPRTSAIAYCQNDISQPLTAEVNDDMEAASNYELVWYDPTTGAELTSAPTPLTDVPGEYTYNVAQRHITTQATSSPSAVKVTIHKLPELTTTMPNAQCGGSVVLSDYIKEKDGMIVTQNYYEDAAKSVAASAVATKSGTYYSDAYYTIGTGIQCKSSTVSVEVTINDLSDLKITGPTTTCPGGSVELTASATSVDPGIVTYRWGFGGGTTSGEKITTPPLFGDYGTKYQMTVTASAGACLETLTETHEVTIDRGVLTGAMTMNGETTKLYKTCGDESITIETSHSGTDYSWSTLDGTSVSGTTSIEVTPTQTTTYVLSLTNVCATSDTVTVEVHPLSVTADWTKLNTTICEGEAFSAELSMTGYDASASGAYIKWYKGDEELTSHANKQTLSVSAGQASDGGVYRYEVSNGICLMPKEGTTDTGELTVVEKATYTKTEGAVSCSGEEVEIAVTANESDAIVTWADDASAGATRTVNPTENTTYKFSVTRQTVCVSEDEVTVSVKEKPEVKVEDVNICAGDKTTLKAETSGDDLMNQGWITSAGDTIMTRTLAIATDSTTNYTAFVESQSCGSAQATMTVTVIPLPELQIDSIGLTSREVSVVGGSSAYYEYKVDNGQWQSTGHFETLTYLLHTAYAKDEYGCQGSLMFEVVAPPVVIPEVFTPEGDGVNDEWDLTNILDAYPNSVVKVFDRYGKQVAELKGDVESWDGTYNGRPLPSTDYWYTINIPEIDRVYSGHFTLIRSK